MKNIFTASHMLEILFVFAGAVVFSVVFLLFRVQPETLHATSMPDFATPAPSTAHLPVPNTASQSDSASWRSPDGSQTLVMNTRTAASGSTTYSFFVTSSATQSGRLIFTNTPDLGTTMSLPFNAWSPDNRFFFLREQSASEAGILVFKASGEGFADSQQFLNIKPLFDAKQTGYVFQEVTGWAAPTLLIVNTKTSDQAGFGPSFWYDISRQSLTRLSTSFQ